MTIAQVHAQVAREEAKQQSSGKYGKKMTMSSSRSSSSHNSSSSSNSEWETIPVRKSHYRHQNSRSSSSSSSLNHSNNSSRKKLKEVAKFSFNNLKSSNTKTSSTKSTSVPDSDSARVPSSTSNSKALSIKLLERKVRGMLKELFSIKDLKEANVVIFELAEQFPELASTISHHIISFGMDYGETEQRLIGQVLMQVITAENDAYSKVLMFQGLEDTVEFMEDLQVDIPHVLKYLGVMLAPINMGGFLDLFLSHFDVLLQLNREKSQVLIEHMYKEMQYLNTAADEALVGEWKSSFESKGWKGLTIDM